MEQTSHIIKPDLLELIRQTTDPGAEYGRAVCCPFHGEREPSLHIYETRTWYCFGCGRHGDAFDYAGLLAFGDAWDSRDPRMFREMLASVGKDLTAAGAALPPEAPPEKTLTKENLAVLRWLAGAFHRRLVSGGDGETAFARRYLRERGFSEGIIRALKIGYAGRMELQRAAAALEPERREAFFASLQEVGVIRGEREYFYRRIIFPDIAPDGSVRNLTGRSVIRSDIRYLNLPKVRKTVYLLELCDPALPLYLTESLTDAVSMRQLGLQASSLNGTALSAGMKAALAAFPDIRIVPQNDAPSVRAALNWTEELPRARIVVPAYAEGSEKDVNDILRLEGERECARRLLDAAGRPMSADEYLASLGSL